MRKFKRVLIAVDFSEITRDVVGVGCHFAREYGAQVDFLHVVEEGFLLLGLDGMALPAEDLESIQAVVEARKAAGREKMEEIEAIARKYDLSRIETAIVEGHPATTIVEEAHERHADAVFVGSHGWSGIKSFLMGSVASKVLKNARCSVMIIRPEVKENEDD